MEKVNEIKLSEAQKRIINLMRNEKVNVVKTGFMIKTYTVGSLEVIELTVECLEDAGLIDFIPHFDYNGYYTLTPLGKSIQL